MDFRVSKTQKQAVIKQADIHVCECELQKQLSGGLNLNFRHFESRYTGTKQSMASPIRQKGPGRWRTSFHHRGQREAAWGSPRSYLLSLVGGEGLLDVHQVQHLEDLGVVHVHPHRALQLVL